MRLLSVDDSQAFHDRLRLVLEIEPDLDVIGEATSEADIVELIRRLRPDLLIISIEAAGPGLRRVRLLAVACSQLRLW